jgi:hypothetical protein
VSGMSYNGHRDVMVKCATEQPGRLQPSTCHCWPVTNVAQLCFMLLLPTPAAILLAIPITTPSPPLALSAHFLTLLPLLLPLSTPCFSTSLNPTAPS